MRIFFDNVDFSSSSGPNSFASKLAKNLAEKGNIINQFEIADVQLSFVMATQKRAPIVQRLDGIYFNSEQDWQSLNVPIKQTYDIADQIIFQTEFDKDLTHQYFGKKDNFTIIHNGTDLEAISKIQTMHHPIIDKFHKVWMCASSWRPHKRLSENIRYFLEHGSEKDCLLIAGKNAENDQKHDRIFYLGDLNWVELVSFYKRSDYFVHLSLMDHCPNVVVDARAAGCKIICASSGGTKEIAGTNATVIKDMDWNFHPFRLYNPPMLDFSKKASNTHDNPIDINVVAEKYLSVLKQATM